MAASAEPSLRGGSGSRALRPLMPARSAAKLTSRSGTRAIARMQPPTARLNGSVGLSFAGSLGLLLEAMTSGPVLYRHRVEVYLHHAGSEMIMAEPENHAFRLSREIRAAIKALDGRVQAMDIKIDRNHQDLAERLDSLKRLAMGESVLGRYATAEFDERLEAIEKRVAALER